MSLPLTALLLTAASASLLAADFDWKLPPGFPRPFVPESNPMSEAKVTLGRYLFYEKRLSVNGKQSCGSCHRQDLAFTDGKAHGQGTTGEFHPRGSMSLVNIAYAPRLTWANPKLDSLEEQCLTPILGENPIELGLKGHEQDFLEALRRDPTYRQLFANAFPAGGDVFTLEHVAQFIASFERTIISMRSPYDRYRWGGDANALSAAAKRGEIIFSSSERGGCFQCHGGWNFSEVRFAERSGASASDEPRGAFFNTGVSTYEAPNRGLYEYTRDSADIGKFRAPTLRNVGLTAPYMHDGSIASLEAVIDHYAAGGKLNHANKSRIMRPRQLTPQDKSDLVEFLKSLTDEELLRDPRWSDPWPKTAAR